VVQWWCSAVQWWAPCAMHQVTPYSVPPDLTEVMKPQPWEQAAAHEEIAASAVQKGFCSTKTEII
jgi:hypothetical protein